MRIAAGTAMRVNRQKVYFGDPANRYSRCWAPPIPAMRSWRIDALQYKRAELFFSSVLRLRA